MQIRDEKHIRYLAEHLLHTGIGQLGRRDIHALRRIALRLQAQYDASVPEEGMTFGERLADRVAEFGGSWTFISLFASLLVGWALLGGA